MAYGHDPRAVREYPWRDVQSFLLMHDIIIQMQTLGGLVHE